MFVVFIVIPAVIALFISFIVKALISRNIKRKKNNLQHHSHNHMDEKDSELYKYISDKAIIGMHNPRLVTELFEWVDDMKNSKLTLRYKSFIDNEIYRPTLNKKEYLFFCRKGEAIGTFNFFLCGNAVIPAPKTGEICILIKDIEPNKKEILIPDNTNILTLNYSHSVVNSFYEKEERERMQRIEFARIENENKEKELIKQKLIAKQKKRDLEKLAAQELMDEGVLFPEANKRPPIPKEVVDAVWNRDGGRCVYCDSTDNLHLDHIIPFSKGGATNVENLQLLCQKCNLEKSNKIG